MTDVVMEDAPPVVLYCVCQQRDGAGLMIECIRGTGGCHGWVHPSCCGLLLTNDELENMADYVCPQCEQPHEKYSGKNGAPINTTKANKRALKKRKANHTPVFIVTTPVKDRSSSWGCSSCTFKNSAEVLECAECLRPKEELHDEESLAAAPASASSKHGRRSSRRSSGKKQKKSYHVPASDEEIGASEDEALEKKKSKRRRIKQAELDYDDQDTEDEDMSLSMKPRPRSSSSRKTKEVFVETAPVLVIDKVLGVRKAQVNEAYAGVSRHSAKEYFVKWKGFSYMHSSWEHEDTLINLDPNANKGKLRRFHEKRPTQMFITQDDEDGYFDPQYLEVHRILSERKEEPYDNGQGETDDGTRYLVKWRGLPYSDCTWERRCDLNDDSSIRNFEFVNTLPPKEQWKPLPHPVLREYKKIDTSPTFGVSNNLSLREYQLEGLNWLVWNWYNHRASILADEMGLGKTIQTLAFLDYLKSNDKVQCRGPFLVVAPLSLVAQWQNESDTWTSMDCVVYHGNTESREMIQNFEFYFNDPKTGQKDKSKPVKFHILVTTFEVAMKDIRLLQKIHWRCLVVDEAHRLKNHQSRLTEQLKIIRRDHCILLTGTPLQNKTEELWALLNFIDQKAFPHIGVFLEKFENLQDSSQVADLHKLLKPYLLRRVKEDVEKTLPPKEETIVEVELTTVQKQWYRAIYERNTSFLYRGGNANNAPNLMNVMMELRKCCNHPYLNNGVEEAICENLQSDAQRFEMLVKCCGKMVLLDKLLPRLKQGNHKVLIFSQMVRVLDILEDYLRQKQYLFERLDGNIRGNERQGAVDRFVKPEYNRFVMLLSTKAGGLGLNLTAADTVIIFDSDWNPQNDLQAQARAHRIGQTNHVKIYRLITRKTYEMHMFHRASLKLGLDRAVLTHMRQENEKAAIEAGGPSNSAKKNKSTKTKAEEAGEIEELLKKGAYDVFREDDSAADQFCAADIDSILQRSSQVVQYEQQARSQFSKASFVSATTDTDVDIDDPDFWKKAVGLEEPDPVVDDLNVPLVRKRTKVSRFGELADSDSDLLVSGDSAAGGGMVGDGTHVGMEMDDDEHEHYVTLEGEQKFVSREWTVNGRERLQRALMHFGFNRWSAVRNQSGGSRNLTEVETFARIFILHCGLCCGEISSSAKEDSAFVKGAITAAQAQEAQYFESGGDMPSVLSDPEYVSKLKQGGARRVLVRLDMLYRLQRLVIAAVNRLDKAAPVTDVDVSVKDIEPCVPVTKSSDSMDDTVEHEEAERALADVEEQKDSKSTTEEKKSDDLDTRVKEYGIEAVADAIQIPDVGTRPTWTKLRPWWNDQADRHLLLGVFIHGYGRIHQIMADPKLCFYQQQHAQTISSEDSKLSDDDDDDVVVAPTPMASPDPEEDEVELEEEDEDIDTEAGLHISSTAEAETTNAESEPPEAEKFKLPEVQQINRLLLWLLSTEDLKRQQMQELARRARMQEKHEHQAALERQHLDAAMARATKKAAELVQMDMFRHETYLFNVEQTTHKDKKKHPLSCVKEWTKEERRSLCYIVASLGIPEEEEEKDEGAVVHKETVDDIRSTSSSMMNEPIQDRPQELSRPRLTWSYVVQRAQLRKPASRVARYVVEKYLPKCDKVAKMTIDRLPTYHIGHPGHLASGGLEYVDLTEKTSAHGLQAKHVAKITRRRIELLKALRFIWKSRQTELRTYGQSVAARETLTSDIDIDVVPVWWCPWLHDVALVESIVRYGVSNWTVVRQDSSLPFHESRVSNLVQKIFLDGCDELDLEPVAKRVFHSPKRLTVWKNNVIHEFPSALELEARVTALARVVLEGQPLCPEVFPKEDMCAWAHIISTHDDVAKPPEPAEPSSKEKLDQEARALRVFIRDSAARRDAFLMQHTGPLDACFLDDEKDVVMKVPSSEKEESMS